MGIIESNLGIAQDKISAGLTAETTVELLELLRRPGLSAEEMLGIRLYPEFLPKGKDLYTPEERYLHFLWEELDRSPLCSAANFAIPFRRMIAKKLFKKCGKNFSAERNIRFNYGQSIEVGDNVFIHEGVLLDSKGGIKIGNSSALAEFVVIFTHGHSESDHQERSYAPVVIEEFCKVYTRSMILPGVTVKKQAIVAAHSVVTKDVPENSLVTGSPAAVVRPRKNEGKTNEDLGHVWLADGAFQTE